MPQPYFEMEESRSVTPWVIRLYFESPRASSFLELRLVRTRHKNLVPLLSGVKPDPMVGSGRYAEPIPVKSPVATLPSTMPPTIGTNPSSFTLPDFSGSTLQLATEPVHAPWPMSTRVPSHIATPTQSLTSVLCPDLCRSISPGFLRILHPPAALVYPHLPLPNTDNSTYRDPLVVKHVKNTASSRPLPTELRPHTPLMKWGKLTILAMKQD